MKKQKKKKAPGKIKFRKMQHTMLLFLLVVLVLIVFQKNVIYRHTDRTLSILPKETVQERTERKKLQSREASEKECLLLWDNTESSTKCKEEMETVLEEMRISYDTVLGEQFQKESLKRYTSVVSALQDFNILGEEILEIMDWVEKGGNLMLAQVPESNGGLFAIQKQLGISSPDAKFTEVEALHFTRPFMLGGQEKDYVIEDSFESSLEVALTDDCEVFVESVDEQPIPVLWRRTLGEGCIVVDNLGFYEKAYRGFHCSAYSLLGDFCAYPVINASVFYLDDFPSPVPGGDSERIKKEFGLNIKEFYTQVWWNDIYNLAEEYGIRYTGLVIEEYSDQTQEPFTRNGDIQRYQYFGNMLLRQGGEIGLHGFNHMPLVLENFDYRGMFDSYKPWMDGESMKAGVEELAEFCEQLYPKEKFQIYVPPSNILSEEGRQMLVEDFENVRAIASVYLPGELAYVQDFEEAQDGMIETPRVISGYILDDYIQLAALCELNFHYVNTHFQHPDDVLDEDRGAKLGWTEMYRRLSEYVKWLYKSAPDIRNFTGSELAGAVQRYDRLGVTRKQTENSIRLELTGFEDEAWFLVRINEGSAGKTTGAAITEVAEGLYLLKAEKDSVEIAVEK